MNVNDLSAIIDGYVPDPTIAHAYFRPCMEVDHLDLTEHEARDKVRQEYHVGLSNDPAGFPSWRAYYNYLVIRFTAGCQLQNLARFDVETNFPRFTDAIDRADFDELEPSEIVELIQDDFSNLSPNLVEEWERGDVITHDMFAEVLMYDGTKIVGLNTLFDGTRTIDPSFMILSEFPPSYWGHFDPIVRLWITPHVRLSPARLDLIFAPSHVRVHGDIQYAVFELAEVKYCIYGFTDLDQINQPEYWVGMVCAPIYQDKLTPAEISFHQTLQQMGLAKDSIYKRVFES